MFVTTRATVQGRAGFGLRHDAPAFPGEWEGFTCLNDEESGRLRRMAVSICRNRMITTVKAWASKLILVCRPPALCER